MVHLTSMGANNEYSWDGPNDDVIAESEGELDEGPTSTMVCSHDRTNYIRTQNHSLHIDEPEDLSHSFKKGGRGEAPTAFGYLLSAAMGCQVNSLEQMLHKARIEEDYEIKAECVGFTVTKDDIKRIQRLELELTLTVPEEDEPQAQRCLDVYEKGCVVGETLKRGMEFRIEKNLELLASDD